jgi:hypothetical protein
MMIAPTLATTPSQSERSDLIRIRIPDPLDCLPERARSSGGRYHEHPFYSSILTEPPILTCEPASYELSAIQSGLVSSAVTFRRKQSTFSFLSLKSGRTQMGESPYELQNAQEKEVDPICVDFQLPGPRLCWDSPEGPRHYTADAISTDVSALITVDEVKASESYFREPSYSALMDRVEEDLSGINVKFRKITGDQMERQRRRRFNVTRLFGDRFTAFGPRQIDAIENLFSQHPEQPLGRLEANLGVDARISGHIVNALMCARHLRYDLDAQLTADSIVRPVPRISYPLPDIRAIKR